MTKREQAHWQAQALHLAPPTRQRTLHVEAYEAPDAPPRAIALFVLRMALENGVTQIHVKQGMHKRTWFDVADLLAQRHRLHGGLHKIPAAKQKQATHSLLAVGNELGTTQPMVATSSIICEETR